MKDEPCLTCNNPIGASLKALREERDRLIPFVTQHRSKRDELLKLEKDIKERSAELAASEVELNHRRDRLERDECALEELLKEARRPEEEFEKLRRESHQLLTKLKFAVEAHKKATEDSNKSIELLRQNISIEKKKRKASDKDAAAAQSELLILEKSHHELKQEFEDMETSHEIESDLLEAAQKEIASFNRERLDLSTQKSASDRKAASLQATNEKLTIDNQQLSKRVSDLRSESTAKTIKTTSACQPLAMTDLDLVHTFSQEITELFTPTAEIITLGSGPFPEYDFDGYLRSLGITPYADGCPWIIVGREGWSKEELDKIIDDADIDEVRVFSQELFVAGILTTHDPFSLPTDILMKFASGHPALEHLIRSGFEWPVIMVDEDYGEPVYLRGAYERVDESPLYRMGYQVGVTHGLSRSKRRTLLKSAFHGVIPNVEDADYMEEWGSPRQSKRLWRIAHHIAWLIRSRKTNSSMRYAVKDWKNDLDWLEEEFYTNRMRFRWPLG